MLRQLVIASALAASLPAYAGLFDTLSAVTQVAASATGKTAPAAPASAPVYDVTPLTTAQISALDCPTLEVTLLNTKRELETVKGNLKQIDALSKDPAYQQQKKISGTVGALGSLLSSKGGKTGEYAQAAQQFGNTEDDSLNVDLQLALAKKYNADIESMSIYKKHKKCK